MHWWAQQHKKPWTSTEDNSGGRSEDPLHPFHNIQPSEEHSPGGTCVKVYNQEKTSRKQIQRVHHKVQIRLFQKTSLKKRQTDHFCKRKAGIKINLYQNDRKKQVWRRLGTAHDQSIQHHLWNMVEQCDGMSMHGFQWHWVTGVYWWRDRGQKQPDEFWSL